MLPSMQTERPAYVRFEYRPEEDRTASIKSGRQVLKDRAYAIITPVGSKDEVIRPVDEWLAQCESQVKQGRLSPTHLELYQRAFDRWKKDGEVPLNGTPIKGWPVLGPSQQQACLSANVRTVEDLALANGEALGRIGMGAVDMKQRAEAWLKAATDLGAVVMQNAALLAERDDLKREVERLTQLNASLAGQIQQPAPPPAVIREEGFDNA